MSTHVALSSDATTVNVGSDDVTIVSIGTTGPRGLPGSSSWTVLTQAAYDALPEPDPTHLYIVIN